MSRAAAFRVAVVAMAMLAAAKLSDELLRLVWRTGRTAAIDLVMRHAEVHAWFAGVPVYETMHEAVYPPATYAMLWPILGWLELEPARWLWAVVTAIALAALVWIVVRESGPADPWGRAFAALLVLAPNETGVAVGNGQLIPLVLPALLAGLLLIHGRRRSWRDDVIAAGCVIFTLVKVSLAVPFLWLVLFAPSGEQFDQVAPWRSFRLRPALLVAAGYGLLTAFAMTFQQAPWLAQLRAWLGLARGVAVRGGDYADVHAWLAAVGLARFILAASAALFLALGAWLYRYRQVDIWVRLGVTALVARFWTYHRVYDDMLVVIALVALLRIAKSEDDAVPTRFATLLLGVTIVAMLLPARLGTSPLPWRLVFTVGHAMTWTTILAFLAVRARKERQVREGAGR